MCAPWQTHDGFEVPCANDKKTRLAFAVRRPVEYQFTRVPSMFLKIEMSNTRINLNSASAVAVVDYLCGDVVGVCGLLVMQRR